MKSLFAGTPFLNSMVQPPALSRPGLIAIVLLSILGIPALSTGAPITVTGERRLADVHGVINFTQIAEREAHRAAMGSTGPVRTNQVHPWLSPMKPSSNEVAQAAPELGGGAVAGPARKAAAASPPVASSFPALADDGTTIPPDTQGAVGPNHLMVALNSQIRIQTRTGATISTASTYGFWAILGVFFTSDPHLAYDPYNNRWIFTMIADAFSPFSSILVAVSQSSDPTGNWFLFKADADPNDVLWADYPTLGFNRNWIVVSVNMYASFGAGYGGAYIYVFNKADLYANGQGNFTFLKDDITPALTMAPAVTYDNTLPLMYLVDVDHIATTNAGNRLRLSTITGTIGNEVLNLGTGFASTTNGNWGFYEPRFGGSAPQLGSPRRIEANDSRIINAVYRNGSIWCSHNAFLPATLSTHCAAQWWQIATNGAVQQFGRIEDPSGQMWFTFPSIAVNANNDVMLGYSSFSPQQYASASYSFRSASDPPNTMEGDTLLKAGLAPYFKDFGAGENRWGDYSATVVDPVNDIDMWTIQEYANTLLANQSRWGTWWGRLDVATLPPARIEFSAATYTVAENQPGFASITVKNIGGLPGSVDFTTTDATGIAGVDYVPVSGTLTFAAGQLATNFSVIIIDNAVVNSNKTVSLSLFNVRSAAILGSGTNAVLTITDDEVQTITTTAGEFNFSSTIYVVTENEVFPAPTREAKVVLTPDRSAYGALITVVRSNGASGRVLVDYATAPGGTAIPFIDFIPVKGTMVFDDFQMSTNFLIEVYSDFFENGDKFVNLELSNPRPDPLEDPETIRPSLGPNSAAVLDILDINFGAPLFFTPFGIFYTNGFNIERAFYRVDEYNSPNNPGGTRDIIVDVVLLPLGGPGSVDLFLHPLGPYVIGCGISDGGANGGEYCYQTVAGSDYADVRAAVGPTPTITDPALVGVYTNSQDYNPFRVTLNFAKNDFRKRVTITVNNDPEVEFNEDFLVHLWPLDNQPFVGENYYANVTILYDDQPAGALDREWNPDLTASTTPPNNAVPGANGTVQALVVQSDGKTILGGDFTAYNSYPRPHVARINFDGSTDLSFNPGLGADGFISSIALYPPSAGADAGKILVAGGFTSFNGYQRNGIARLMPDGSVDTTFVPGNGADAPVRSVALQPDGRILISGEFTQFNDAQRAGFARLNPDGSVDGNFNTGTGADATVWAVAFDSAGRVLIGGDFLSVNNVFAGRVARLNIDGSVDTSFNPGGGADGGVYAIAVQTDGSILIGGGFTHVDTRNRFGIARLGPDGALDLAYDPGYGANDTINTIVLQPDNKAIIGGYFTSYGHARRMSLARLKANGTLDTSFMDTAYNQFAGLINTFSFEPPNFLNAIALQADGNVMIGGSFHQIGGNPSRTVKLRNPWTVYTRADKRTRLNIARVLGGVTPGPGNAEFESSEYFVDENGTTASIRLRRIDGRLGTLKAISVSSNRTAQAGIDYLPVYNTNIWAESVLTRPYWEQVSIGDVGFVYDRVTISNNTLLDGNRVLDLSFLRPEGSMTLGGEPIPLGGALGKQNAPLTIVDEDVQAGVFNFSSVTYATNENAGFATITVVRNNGSIGAASVDYLTRESSITPIATASGPNADYTPQSGKLNFLSGQTSRSFTVPILDDSLVEFDENIALVLTNATGGARLPGGSATSIITATLTILDNDFPSGRINFSAPVYATNSESDGFAIITVTRTGGNAGSVSVQFQTIDGTAISLRDYLPTNGVLTWNSGDSAAKTFRVPLIQNGLVVPSNTVTLRLFDPKVLGSPDTNLLGLTTNATLIIQDSDAYGMVAFSQPFYEGDENGGRATITVVRTAGVAGTGTVEFATSPGTALPGSDYFQTNGLLTFLPGELSKTFQVPLLDNTDQDGNRALTLTLANPTNVMLGLLSRVTLTIIDDESVNEPAGSTDVTFRDPLVNGAIFSISLQKTNGVSDGRLVIAGDFTNVNHVVRNRLARLLTNGVLDTSFDAGSGTDGSIRTTAVQPDGRLVIGGFFTQVAGTNRNSIARLTPDGRLDVTFNPGSGADNPVFSVVIQPDAKVLVGGSFSKFNSFTRPSIVRLNTNGAVDLNFNTGAGPNEAVYAIAVQNDGKVLIGGEFTQVNGLPFNHLARLNSNGSVDTSFNGLGTGLNAAVRAILVQPDGKILVGGSFTNVNGTNRNYLARLNSNGGLDAQFLLGAAGGNNAVYALAAQPDGKLVVVGDFSRFNGVTRSRITRLFADGSTDGGINFGSGADSFINTVVVQPDRKIIIGGAFTHYDDKPHDHIARLYGGSIIGAGTLTFTSAEFRVNENSTNAFITVRRNGGTMGTASVHFETFDGSAQSGRDYVATRGTLTFANGETLTNFMVRILDNTTTNDDRSLVLTLSEFVGAGSGLQPIATLVIVNDESAIGFASDSFSVSEAALSGTATILFKRSYATNSTVSALFSTVAGGTAPPNVKYVPTSNVVTFLPGETSKSATVRIINETAFEGNQTVFLALSNPVSLSSNATAYIDVPSAILTIVDDDFGPGAISFSAPTYSVLENATNAVINLVRNGGSLGVVSVYFTTINSNALAGADYTARSERIVFGQSVTNQTILIPINNDDLVEGAERFIVSISDAQGGAVINSPSSAVVTILDDEFRAGSLDLNFDPKVGPNNYVRSVAAQSNGQIVIGGAFTSFSGTNRPYFARLNTNGALDLTFNTGSGPNAAVSSVGLLSESRVVLGGGFTSLNGLPINRVARLNSSGAPDMNFVQSGAAFDASVNVVASDSFGRILAGGAFSRPAHGVVRLRLDGSVDPSFNPGLGANGPIYALALQTNGQMIVGGGFTSFGSVYLGRLARLDSDGSLDDSFASGAITNGNVYCVTVQPDGKVIAGGDFYVFGKSGRVGLARFNVDGSLVGSPGTELEFAL